MLVHGIDQLEQVVHTLFAHGHSLTKMRDMSPLNPGGDLSCCYKISSSDSLGGTTVWKIVEGLTVGPVVSGPWEGAGIPRGSELPVFDSFWGSKGFVLFWYSN